MKPKIYKVYEVKDKSKETYTFTSFEIIEY